MFYKVIPLNQKVQTDIKRPFYPIAATGQIKGAKCFTTNEDECSIDPQANVYVRKRNSRLKRRLITSTSIYQCVFNVNIQVLIVNIRIVRVKKNCYSDDLTLCKCICLCLVFVYPCYVVDVTLPIYVEPACKNTVSMETIVDYRKQQCFGHLCKLAITYRAKSFCEQINQFL